MRTHLDRCMAFFNDWVDHPSEFLWSTWILQNGVHRQYLTNLWHGDDVTNDNYLLFWLAGNDSEVFRISKAEATRASLWLGTTPRVSGSREDEGSSRAARYLREYLLLFYLLILRQHQRHQTRSTWRAIIQPRASYNIHRLRLILQLTTIHQHPT